MNVLSFRLFSWYSSGVFILIVIILILVYIIVFDGVSSLIIALFSSVITLPVFNSGKGDYNDLSVALGIKPGAYNLDNYDPNVYNLPI